MGLILLRLLLIGGSFMDRFLLFLWNEFCLLLLLAPCTGRKVAALGVLRI
jgi:hypothetical protein